MNCVEIRLDVDLFELRTESDASTLVRFRGSPNWSVASLAWSEYCYILSRCEHGFLNRESAESLSEEIVP
jgi:hypothetical protein